MSFALNRSGGEDAWPEPPEVFVHQLADEIGERRRPAPDSGRRFRLSFALVAAVALLLPLAAFADQAGDNLARREDSAEVELVATDDDDDGGGGGDSDSDSETSVAGQYDVGGDSDSDSSGHVGEYDVGGGDDSESDDGAAAGGGEDSDSGDGSDDGAAADQAPLQPVPAVPAPAAPGGGDDDSDDGGGDSEDT